MMSAAGAFTGPPMSPQSFTSLAQSRPLTCSTDSPERRWPLPNAANASNDLRRGNAPADSANPAGTSGVGLASTEPRSALTFAVSSSNSSTSTRPSPSTSNISNNSPALLARTPSSAPMSANATDTSPKSRYPEPSTS